MMDERFMPKRYRLVYAGIRVRDLKKSTNFYRKVMGMRVTRRGTMPHGGKYVALRSPGSSQELELNWYPRRSKYYSKYRRGDELDHLAFGVGNVKAALAKLISKGVELAVSPAQAKGVTEIYVKDPDGIWLELLNW
jgi:lactoylglutathione lyase